MQERINKRVLQLAAQLHKTPMEGLLDVIPAYSSLTVIYDPLSIHLIATDCISTYVTDWLNEFITRLPETALEAPRKMIIPVCYHPSLGPDIEGMAAEKNMSLNALIAFHTSVTYRVYMTGFLPGFAYMGMVDDKIATARKATPRQFVAAGSVGIAGSQTGIYPLDSPGGWNIIGQTPVKVFDKEREQPCLLKPGDEVVFEMISRNDFDKIKQQQ